MSENFDLVVIGGGPGGYVAAIKAAQLGMKVACVEKRGSLGGTCLNVGCIPSKVLLNSSYLYKQAKDDLSKHGIKVKGVDIDIEAMHENKDKIVSNLTKGIEMLFGKNKITYKKALGVIKSNKEVLLKFPEDKEEVITTKNILIATGSEVSEIPSVQIDGKQVISSDHAIALKKAPERMLIIGAGVIGLELGSVWSRLGSEVTIAEYSDRIVPSLDMEVSNKFQKILEGQKIKFKLGRKVLGLSKDSKEIKVSVEDLKEKKEEIITTDIVLVAAGRKARTSGLGLENAGIAVDDKGKIKTDSKFRTNVENIYAIGDVIDGPMLAHKAEEDGIAAVEIMNGQAGHVDYNLVPGVIYTHPEVAFIGKTEEQLKKENISYNTGKFPFLANSRACATSEKEGFVKILADKETDEILGVHILGAHAGTIIAEASVAMAYKASSEDISRICHSHPDLNEAVKEAALGTYFKPIHI